MVGYQKSEVQLLLKADIIPFNKEVVNDDGATKTHLRPISQLLTTLITWSHTCRQECSRAIDEAVATVGAPVLEGSDK